jgi:5-methylcytosine-specific restriction endonuclease McrA
MLRAQGKLMCYLCCEKILTSGELTADHILPRKLGGMKDDKNLLPTHKRCNQMKADWLLSQLFERGFYDKVKIFKKR